MASVYEIPLLPIPQRFSISLSGVTYTLTFQFRNEGRPGVDGSWVLDIGDNLGNPMVCGIPLVTGVNLLEQYNYMGFGGELWVVSDGDRTVPPTFTNIGTSSRVYWVVQ
jgi:hypothetical protein